MIPKTWYSVGRKKRHLIEILHDGDETLVVSKWWSRKWGGHWRYVVEVEWEVLHQIKLVTRDAQDEKN